MFSRKWGSVKSTNENSEVDLYTRVRSIHIFSQQIKLDLILCLWSSLFDPLVLIEAFQTLQVQL